MRLLNPARVTLEWAPGQRDRTIGRPLRQLGAEGCWITSSARSSSDGGIVKTSHAMVSHTSDKSVMLPSSFSMTR